MKHTKFAQTEKSPAAQPAFNGNLNKTGIDFTPSVEEVARRAYFAYVNEGSPPGRDVQHWLDAEAQLTAERNGTRVHAFRN